MATASLRQLRVALARVHQLIGWAGIAGVLLLVAASVVTALAWSTQKAHLQAAGTRHVVSRQSAPSLISSDPVRVSTPDLPPISEVPLLLTQMKHAAASNGLEWRAADYRIIAATSTYPASLEVRWAVKGPYPKLRGMLVQLMSAVPAFTIREFSASRPNADVADVDVKLVLAVFLRDGAIATDAPIKGAP